MVIAWALAKGRFIVLVVNWRLRAQLTERLSALDEKLTTEKVAALEAAVQAGAVTRTRYDAAQMRVLDSEK